VTLSDPTEGHQTFDAVEYTQNNSPGGSTKREAESDVYDYLFGHKTASVVVKTSCNKTKTKTGK